MQRNYSFLANNNNNAYNKCHGTWSHFGLEKSIGPSMILFKLMLVYSINERISFIDNSEATRAIINQRLLQRVMVRDKEQFDGLIYALTTEPQQRTSFVKKTQA